ncbi:myo-inosose-2 dehydratase, partial [Bacillus cereus]|nr:myo-inosose-2 dehydratase [Bacillus cereus]
TVVLKKSLELRKLEIASAWFSAFLTTKPLEETVQAFIKHRDFLHEMGAKVIVVSEQGHSIQGLMDVPLFQNKPVFTAEEWDKLADGLHHL